MGQYFKAVNLDRQQYVLPLDYGSGLKLMEHSWLYSPFVNAVMGLLAPGRDWYKGRIVWAGDYMDEGIFLKGITGRNEQQKTLYSCCTIEQDQSPPCISVITPRSIDGPHLEIIANHDKKQYVLLKDLPEEYPSDPGWHIHPLPLLTCSGNGASSSDFNYENKFTGSWAGDHISSEYIPPSGYRRIIPAFTELNNNR